MGKKIRNFGMTKIELYISSYGNVRPRREGFLG